MKTPARFNREPGKLPTPPLRPQLPVTTDEILTTDYTDYADFSDQRVSPLCFPLSAVPPKSVTSVKSVVETPSFVSMGACRTVVRRRPVHSWFPLDFIAPALHQIAVNCTRLHQIAVNCTSRPGAGLRQHPSHRSTLHDITPAGLFRSLPVTSGLSRTPRSLPVTPTGSAFSRPKSCP